MELPSRIQADIDLDAFAFNLESIKKNLKEDTKIIAVLKADGYGHGALPLAREAAKDPRVWGIAVATVEEAEELRLGGIQKPLLILGYTYEENYERIVRGDFRPAVFKLSMAKKLSQAAVKNNTVVKVHIKIDTGMSRIGYRDLETAVPEILEISRLPGVKIEGLMRKKQSLLTGSLKSFRNFRRLWRPEDWRFPCVTVPTVPGSSVCLRRI